MKTLAGEIDLEIPLLARSETAWGDGGLEVVELSACQAAEPQGRRVLIHRDATVSMQQPSTDPAGVSLTHTRRVESVLVTHI